MSSALGDRAGLDADQGGPGRARPRGARDRRARLGERVRRPAVDLPARGRVGRAPGGLRRAGRPRFRRRARHLGDDARLPRLRRRRRAAGAVPHLAQHEHRARRRRQLSERFGQNIPHRWSVAHLYQALLDHEEHVGRVAFVTTLAGYVHWQLTGEKVIGVGDASGMFPIDPATRGYDERMLGAVRRAGRPTSGSPRRWSTCCRGSCSAGETAGVLTEDGAARLDPSGGCGRACRCARRRATPARAWWRPTRSRPAPATSAPAPASSPWSCSTAALSRPHRELDLVTTPAGDAGRDGALQQRGQRARRPGRRCSREFAEAAGARWRRRQGRSRPCSARRSRARPTAAACVAYNYLAGEPITELEEGRPLFVRTPGSPPATSARSCGPSSTAPSRTLRIGMDVLQHDEGVAIDAMFAHGGLFKTKGVAQRFLAAAVRVPVSVGRRGRRGRGLGHRRAGRVPARPAGRTRAWPTTSTRVVFADASWARSSRTRPTRPASTRSWSAGPRASPSSARRWSTCADGRPGPGAADRRVSGPGPRPRRRIWRCSTRWRTRARPRSR